jgi:phytoene synthase
MAMDLTRKEYATIADLDTYLYGSSEVIGLFMARILDLPEASYPAARLLGKAMQFINFIRDIEEDQALGRTYLPREEWETFGLAGLSREEAFRHPGEFTAFIRTQLDRYCGWQKEAQEGFAWIPWRYLVPIRTASDMYRWTGEVIRADPLVVYSRKVKPSIPRILASVLGNGVRTAPVLLLGPSLAVSSAVR